MTATYLRGFASQYKELQAQKLEIKGTIPDWLAGTLLRNGPGRYELDKGRVRHWFDGFAMLHKFDFSNGDAYYTNRMVQSKAWKKASKNGEIAYREVASQPHANLFDLLMYLFFPTYTDNNSISVASLNNSYLAMSESPHLNEFDLKTLKTIGPFKFDDKLQTGFAISPHPHYDFTNQTLVNFTTGIYKRNMNSFYNVFCVDEGSRKRRLLAQVREYRPAYMHSFAITEHYAILIEFPIILQNFLGLIFSTKPVIDEYDWLPERGTRFHVINKADGSVRTWQGKAAFAFHQVNAFERGNDIIIDLVGYDEMVSINNLLLESLLLPEGDIVPRGELRRYILPSNSSNATYDVLVNDPLELPRINYTHYNTKDYRWTYMQGIRNEPVNDFYNELLKVDVKNGQVTGRWSENEHYPMEPVFVPKPNATAEDEGIILSVVLDGVNAKSYLLVLDAQTFEQQATIHVPQVIPFGFHGIFVDNNAPLGTVVQ